MKRLISLLAFSFVASTLSAMPTLNPADPAVHTTSVFAAQDCWSMRLGYRGDFVTNRKLRNIKKFSLYSNEALVIANLWDVVDAYAFAGSGSYSYQDVQNDAVAVPVNVAGRSNQHLIWGLGVKAVIAHVCWKHFGETFFAFDAQVEYMMSNRFRNATINGVDVAINDVGFNYREGQVAFGIAHKIENLIPYAAITWSSAYAKPSSAQILGTPGTVEAKLSKTKSRERFGFAIGTSLIDARKMSVTAEARFITECAFTICAQMRY